jgi:hypothetical protein
MPFMETKLEQAARHVRRGREIIQAQRLRILALQQAGVDATSAKDLLVQYERSQMIFEADLAEMQRRA